MRVLIKKVEYDEVSREGPTIIHSFWIYGLLKNGREIKIFDSVTFDLRKYENQELDLLIFCKLSNIPNDAINGDELYYPVLEGEYLGEINIPDNWKIGWRFKPKNKENPIIFHAIRTENVILIIKPNNIKNYSVKYGDKFKFKVIRFDLMAWEPIEGKKIIDPTNFEKNIINKFWILIESTHEKSKHNTEQQIQLLNKELMKWNYDEIWLFDDILKHLSTALRSNHSFYKEKLEVSVDNWTGFYQGIVALGNTVYKKALLEPKRFFHDVLAIEYSDNPRAIELVTKELIQNVIEKKSEKSIEYVVGFMLRKDIEDVRERIGAILDIEFKIDKNT